MRLSLLISASAALFLTACNREVPIRADTIYTGGTIYTGLNETDTVEAVAVGEGLIVFTGDVETAMKLSKGGAQIVSFPEDSFIYPGFTDAHVHLSGIGQRELTLNLDDALSIEALKAKLLAYREENPDAPVIMGRGWIETHWPEARFPLASDIDAVISDIPVVLIRADGHAAVANTAAMSATGVTSETEIPSGGDILKDDAGTPNGMFIDNAMGLLWSVFSDPGPDEMTSFVQTGFDVYAARGWTGVHNMSVDGDELDALRKLAIADKVKLRTYNAVTPDQIDAAINRTPSGKRLTTRAVKIYMDGALGSRGALLSKPYSDAPDTRGLSLWEKDETLALFEKALDGNVQVSVHAIGDLGNTHALDWMEAAFEAGQAGDGASEAEEDLKTEPRWRVEHAQIVKTEDQKRFAELGVIASMQPSHAIGDLHFAPSRLGMERLGIAYAWRDMTDAGVLIAGGSDAPVEVGDPIIEFYAASVRKDLKGFSADGWHPEQVLTRFETLKLFTQNAAYAAFMEDDLGTIEVGKHADFTVFDQDILTIADTDLLATKPVMTIVDGGVVWAAE